MTNPYYRASVEVFQRRLDGLAHYVQKGVDFADARAMKDADFLGARLHADMLPLVAQVRIATDHAKGGAGRLAGVEPPTFADDEASIPELLARIGKARAFLDTLSPEQFDGVESRRVVLNLRGDTLEFAAPAYLHHFAVPNFYFHVVTAYDILRAMGVSIGKPDFFGGGLVKE